MSFFDFFRDFLYGDRHGSRRQADPEPFGGRFRNPIWQNEDEDSDDLDDFRRSRNNFRYKVFSEPLEIARFFEAEMDNLLKNFFHGFRGDDFFGVPSLPDPSDPSLLPPDSGGKNLRDQVLKPEYEPPVPPEEKMDKDLDGIVTANNLATFWKKEPEPDPRPTFSFRSSVRRFVRKPDGTVEEKEEYTDHEGNVKTVIKRRTGDKKYTITTEKNKYGEEIRREDVEELDKDQPLVPSKDFDGSSFDHSWWRTIFGPNPKL